MEKRLNSAEFVALHTQHPALKPLFEDVVEAAILTKRHLARAHKLVESFKRLSVNQLTDKLETLRLAEVVTSVVELFSINARKAKLEISIIDQLPLEMQAWTWYPGYLTQVLLNLLTNIERYAYPEGAGGRIAITLAAEHATQLPGFALVVEDFGVGIAPDPLSRIFDPFFTTGRSKGGTGLGMTIAYNLVTEALQGKIQLTSTLGAGTRVALFLPKVVTPLPPLSTTSTAGSRSL